MEVTVTLTVGAADVIATVVRSLSSLLRKVFLVGEGDLVKVVDVDVEIVVVGFEVNGVDGGVAILDVEVVVLLTGGLGGD